MTATGLPPDLVSLVYAGATDRDAWQGFCDALSEVTESSVMLYGHDANTYESLGLIGAEIDPAAIADYHAYFAALNPWMHMNLTMPVGTVGVSDTALSRDDLFRTEFYNDWLRPQENIVSGSALVCHRSPDRFVGLVTACRARGVDDRLPRVEAILKGLSPHLLRSIAISAALRRADEPTAFPGDSPFGVLLVRRSGRLGHRNGAAVQFLDGCDGMLSVDQRGRLSSPQDEVADFVASAVRALQAEAPGELPGPTTVHTVAFGLCALHVHYFPRIVEDAFPDSVWSDPVVGAFVVAGPLGLDGAGDYRRLALALGATPAEARLAAALMAGRTLYDYADEHALSRHTVRNQMRALLLKTDTLTQADFIRSMARLASPFGPAGA